ncbi:hypothetical protein [Orientia tsutsugamushi]|uniref:hypothetical protein n=1 Tax=Orientia tsutsugamushi TaxID=784 RepID=UPI0002D3A301|nr:hypothetical protein [Orientia tsutsugamushi]
MSDGNNDRAQYENTWLTKLEHIKLLSSQNQDIKFNNLAHIIIDYNMLLKA